MRLSHSWTAVPRSAKAPTPIAAFPSMLGFRPFGPSVVKSPLSPSPSPLGGPGNSGFSCLGGVTADPRGGPKTGWVGGSHEDCPVNLFT
jgi:hypothetical protein